MTQQFHFWAYVPKTIEKRNSNRYLYTYVHCGIIHNSQKMKAIWVSIYEWMNKVCISIMKYYLALSRKEILTYITSWVKLEDIPVAKGQILYLSTYKRYVKWSNSSRQKVSGGCRDLKGREREVTYRLTKWHWSQRKSLVNVSIFF